MRCLIRLRIESSFINIGSIITDNIIVLLQITSSGKLLMYSRKNAGPRMEPWGTLALTGYFCEHLPSRTTWSHLLLTQEEIKPNIWPEIPYDLRRPACQTVKSLGHIWCYSSSSPRPVKNASNSIRYNCKKIAVDQLVLKPYWKSEKRAHFARWLTILLFRSFSKTLLTIERRLTGW